MGKSRRRVYKLGGSRAVTYPHDVTVGEESTMAGSRLLLVDPRGEVDENDLAAFMETHVESIFWEWLRQKQASRRPHVAEITALQAERPVAEEAQPVEAKNVTAGPPVYLVLCWRCSGQIAWRLDLGSVGSCPYCGAWCRLVTLGTDGPQPG